MEKLTAFKDLLLSVIPELAKTYGPKILLAIAIAYIGFKIISKIEKVLEKMLRKSGFPEDISPFIVSLLAVVMKVFLLLSAAGVLGFEATSLVAVLAAAGFAIGMALQGSLANFAAGVMILVFKPYKVKDVVEIQGQMGRVREIQIFNTIVTNFDNRTAIIPNSIAISDVMNNLSDKKNLRVDLEVFMPYEEDFDKVEKVILEALRSTPNVLSEPAPFVGIQRWDSHSLALAVYPYCNTDDYWNVYYGAYKNITKAMASHGIKVAYSEGVELGKIG